MGRVAGAPEGASPRRGWQRGWSLWKPRFQTYSPAPFFASVFRCYSEVFFINGSPLFGTLIFVSTLLNWNVGLSGVIAVLAAYVLARLIHLDQEFFQPGFYTYNPLLVGLSLGSILQLSWLTAFFIVAVAALTLLLTIGMVNVFRYYLNLPVLSLPFAVVSVIAYLASLRYSNLLVQGRSPHSFLLDDYSMPLCLSGFFRSLGAVFFLPHVLAGFLFSLLLLGRSRILFLLAVLGYYVGTLVRAAMLGSMHQAFGDVSNFNFILIAMALGGVFLTPSPASYLVAAAAVAMSTFFLDAVLVFGSQHGIPVYTLPFNIICLGTLYCLGLTAFPRLARYIGLTPEDTLEDDLVNRRRYPGHVRTLTLPFFGQWTVWQAFDDGWTHKGIWRFACDFVITDDEGQTFEGVGLKRADYYCWRKPVLAPTRGRVSVVVDDSPDNRIGDVDKTNNWGNYVVIYDERGYYVKLAHFAQESICVKPGDWVEPGTIIGLCGNSGYSPQPHLHIHIQAYQYADSLTLPFSFVAYIASNHYHSNDLPAKGDRVEPAPAIDPHLNAATGLLLGDQLTYDVYKNGRRVDCVSWRVGMAVDGTLCLESRRGRLYFGTHAGTFYFYRADGTDPYLRLLSLALPRLPLSYRDGLKWKDYVPISLVTDGAHRMLADLAAMVAPNLVAAQSELSFLGPHAIRSEVTGGVLGGKCRELRVELDADRGFAVIQKDHIELRRTEYVAASSMQHQ